MKFKIALFLILVFAFFLRAFNLSGNPPSLNWDEVSIGYNAYSVLKTGRDEWGQFLPTIFRAYGDYKLPVYVYSAIPTIFFFGLNSFSVRLASVLAGTTTVFFSYLISKYLFKKQSLALLIAMLVAIEPWSLFLSRIALEANLAVALVVAGIYFMIVGIEKENHKNIFFSSILLGLSLWTYNSARVFVPLFLISSFLIYFKTTTKILNKLFLPVALFCCFFIPMLWQVSHSEGSARYQNVKILDDGAIAKIIEQRNTTNLPPKLSRLIFNKPVYFTKVFLSNYLSHFSTDFLFINGGNHYQFNVPGNGLLFEINMIFMLTGIVVISHKKGKYKHVLFSWLLLAPIASSLTRESPHALRDIVFLPLPMILSGVGIYWTYKNYPKFSKIFSLLYLFVLVFSFSLYLKNYTTSYKNEYSWAWQYGMSDVADFITANYQKYDKIIVTKKYGEPHEFLLFYGASNNQSWALPENYLEDTNLNRFYQTQWYWVDGFDKFYFMNDWQIPNSISDEFVQESKRQIDTKSGSILLVTSPDNYPREWHLARSIYFLDGKKAFDIVEKI